MSNVHVWGVQKLCGIMCGNVHECRHAGVEKCVRCEAENRCKLAVYILGCQMFSSFKVSEIQVYGRFFTPNSLFRVYVYNKKDVKSFHIDCE